MRKSLTLIVSLLLVASSYAQDPKNPSQKARDVADTAAQAQAEETARAQKEQAEERLRRRDGLTNKLHRLDRFTP